KERRADIDGKETVEILDRVVLDHCGLRGTGIGDEDIQSVANNGANLLGKFMRPVGRGQIGADGIGPAARIANFLYYGGGFAGIAAIMNEHLRTGSRQGQRSGPTDATRCACDECRLSRQTDHDLSPYALVPPSTVRFAPVM